MGKIIENVVCIEVAQPARQHFRYGPGVADTLWLAGIDAPAGPQPGDKGTLVYHSTNSRGWYEFVPDGTRDELYNAARFRVVEGVSGNYRYHLAANGTVGKSLCGELIMNTEIPAAAWGVSGHLREHWCADCQAIANGAPTLADGRALNNDHKQLLAALDEQGGFTSRQLRDQVPKTAGEGPTAHSARVRKLLGELEAAGLARKMDEQTPICWLKVPRVERSV